MTLFLGAVVDRRLDARVDRALLTDLQRRAAEIGQRHRGIRGRDVRAQRTETVKPEVAGLSCRSITVCKHVFEQQMRSSRSQLQKRPR